MKKFTINHIGVSFNADSTYALDIPGFGMNDCRSFPVINGVAELVDWQLTEQRDGKIVFSGVTASGDWQLIFAATGIDGISLQLKGILRQPLDKIKLNTLTIHALNADHLLPQWITMGHCKSIRLTEGANTTFSSYYQTIITSSGKHLQVAFPLQTNHLGCITGKVDGTSLRDITIGYDINAFDGTVIEGEPVSFRIGDDGFRLMNEWGDQYADHGKFFSGTAGAGWNTWDYYRWTINEEEVLKNAEFIAKDPVLSKHIKRIIVDDGWQYCYGEWDANKFFPNGMEYLAKELTKMGFEPGLWFAPSIIEPHSIIAQTELDMLACGDSGYPCLGFECMKRNGFLLDPTVPKVKKYLFELFDRYAGMGYKHFKLDFLRATLNARSFADRSVPHGRIVEMLLEPIHKAVSGRAQILGCNYPFMTGTAYVDAVRIGSDIHADWKSIRENAVSVAARSWSHRKLWINDPDFAICRGLDTSDDPALTKLKPLAVFVGPNRKADDDFNANFGMVEVERDQLEILLGIVLMSGGAINYSDNMPRLNASGLDLARRSAAAVPGNAATALDLFENELPSRWIQQLDGGGFRVMLVNWSDSTICSSFDFTRHGISAQCGTNFWNGGAIEFPKGILRTSLKPRSCLLVQIDKTL